MLFVTAGPLNEWISELPQPWGKLARHRLQDFYFLRPFAHLGGEADRRRRKEHCLGQCWWLINVTMILFLSVSYLFLPAVVYRIKMGGAKNKLNLLDVFAMAILIALVMLLVRLVIIYLARVEQQQGGVEDQQERPAPEVCFAGAANCFLSLDDGLTLLLRLPACGC